MIAYHLASRFPGRIEFVDLRGLVSGHWTRCAVSKSVGRNKTGLGATYDDYFRRAEELQRDCEIPIPDIIFDLYTRQRTGRKIQFQEVSTGTALPGYQVIYMQPPSVTCPAVTFCPDIVESGQFIAVRRGLLDDIGLAGSILEP